MNSCTRFGVGVGIGMSLLPVRKLVFFAIVSVSLVLFPCAGTSSYVPIPSATSETQVQVEASKLHKKKPNIILFLTDDQDQMLGGSFPVLNHQERYPTPMPKTQRLLANEGITATEFFIHTPICCPSRAELLSGRYFHNIKQVGRQDPKTDCMHVNTSRVNSNTFAKLLKAKAGYKVGLFGKYLNNMPPEGDVPPGFDAWFANNGGTYIAPSFQTKGITGMPDGKWSGSKDNYSTSVIGNISVTWIREMASQSQPFFAYIAPKAAHEPFNPAPWYKDYWNPSWPKHEPRPPNWNCSDELRAHHHGNIATQSLISPHAADIVTDVFKNRWRTLMSVDDLIEEVVELCRDLNIYNTTYFFFTSDHGFQLGQFNMLMDKRHVYDWNTRIHLLAVGPGIPKGVRFHYPATQVDLAPTFLGLAGIKKPWYMDGKSLVPLLLRKTAHDYHSVSVWTRRHLETLPSAEEYASRWRKAVFFEYYYNDPNVKCVDACIKPRQVYPNADTACGILASEPQDCWGGCVNECYPTENVNNNFIAIRHVHSISPFSDTLYAVFQTGNQRSENINFDNVDFVEYYETEFDPWMLVNKRNSLPDSVKRLLDIKLRMWFKCRGNFCP